MKKNRLQIMSLVVVLLLVVPFISNAQSGKADFSGTWAMNAEKSNLGEAAGGPGGGRGFGGGGGDFVAKQAGNALTVERTMNRQGEETTRTTEYTLDGKEKVTSSDRGDSKVTATWSADGKSLTIATSRSFNGTDRTTSEIWTLKDAKTLAITSKRQDRDGNDVETTRVYDKK